MFNVGILRHLAYHTQWPSLDSPLYKIYWRKRREAFIHCGKLNELFFIQHPLPNKISSYIDTRDYDSPDLYRYLCMFFHFRKIHLCTCSYRIPGCCYTLHYHYSYALHWHTRLYLKQQKQSNWKTFNWNGVIQNVSLWHSVSPWFFAIFLPHVK